MLYSFQFLIVLVYQIVYQGCLNKIILFLIFGILFSSFVAAEPSFFFKANNDVDLKLPCINDGAACSTLATCNITIDDPLMKLANNNSGDSFDTGFYAKYNDGTDKFSGLFRDATNNTFNFFTGTTIEPTNTVDTSSVNGYSKGDIVVGNINADTTNAKTNRE